MVIESLKSFTKVLAFNTPFHKFILNMRLLLQFPVDL